MYLTVPWVFPKRTVAVDEIYDRFLEAMCQQGFTLERRDEMGLLFKINDENHDEPAVETLPPARRTPVRMGHRPRPKVERQTDVQTRTPRRLGQFPRKAM